MNKMSDSQRRMICVLAKEKGIDDENLHSRIYSLTGKASMTQLTIRDAIKVIDELKGKKPAAAGMVSDKQAKLIKGLAVAVCWVDGAGALDEKKLGGWLYRRYGISALSWLTVRKAADAIEGLKAIKFRLVIRGLAVEIGWMDEAGELDEKKLAGWLYDRYGISSINNLTAKKASDVIEGLKTIKQWMDETQEVI